MKTLYLLRHAKASPGDAGMEDADRPLNEVGREQADRLSDHLAPLLPPPTAVWCSPARRTRETLSFFLEVWPLENGATHLDPDLYLASGRDLLHAVRTFPDAVEVVMLLGHNPGLTDLLHALVPGVGGDLKTCELAQVDFDLASWGEVEEGTGRLKLSLRPNDLPA